MGNYTKATNFATKDTLTSGDPLKIVKGTEINTEFDNIATAVNSKSDTASPTFTGTVTTPILSVTGASTFGTTITYGGVTLTASVTGTGKMVLDTSPTITGLTANGVISSLPVIDNIKMGYTTTATAAGTTTLTVASNYRQFFTGSTTQTIVLPVTSTLVTGIAYEIENNSTGLLTVNSSGGNLVGTIPAGVCAHAVCIATSTTTAADWDWDYISTSTITGTGANVLGTSPTLVTPVISSITNTGTLTLPTSTDTLVGRATTDTLTNKTLTNPTVTNYVESVVAIGNSSTSKTLDLTNGTVQTVTMTGNCTFTMPTATAGKSFVLIVSSGAGGFTGTFTSVKWPNNGAPTLTTTASRWDILTFFADGTNWYGTFAQAFQ